MRHAFAMTLVSAIVALPPSTAAAQVRAGKVQTISQIVDCTNARIQYSRPKPRGRDVVFGTRAVQSGEVWTPGANWATTLDVDHPITLGGVPVSKGSTASG